jgi:hypothetical protein
MLCRMRDVRSIATSIALALATVLVGALSIQQQDGASVSFTSAVVMTLKLFGVLAAGPLMFAATLWAYRLLVEKLRTVRRGRSHS